MLKIRLQRIGRKNDPSFRVVVTEHTRGPKSEKHVDRVGFYNPKTKEQKLDTERIKHWISKGAQPSDTVHNMLLKAGVITGNTINVLPQKTPVIKEVDEKDDSQKPVADDSSKSDETKESTEEVIEGVKEDGEAKETVQDDKEEEEEKKDADIADGGSSEKEDK